MYKSIGLSNNLNCMDYEFQHYASCLDYIYAFLVVDDLFHTFIFR